jgi:RNA polymerase sigma-70 factor (ECF subfamily)
MSELHPSTSDGGEPTGSSTSTGLLARARRGDSRAWDRLSLLYTPLMFHWCQRRGLRSADAADVVQEVFQAVAENLGRFRKREETDTFRGWLRTITENKIRDHFRKTAHEVDAAGGTDALHRLAQVPAPSDPESVAAAADWDGQFLRVALDLARQEFEERTWLAFWRTAVEGRPPREVGPELAMTQGAVRVAKSRVLRRLREELGDLDP